MGIAEVGNPDLEGSHMDSLTVLMSTISATKVWKEIDGKVVAEPYGRARHFDAHKLPLAGFGDLISALHALETKRTSFVIRGALKDESNCKNVMRRIHGSDAPFKTKPRRCICIDLDDLDLPPHWSDFNNHTVDIVRHATTFLPSEFAKANCWWQFSSSMGMKPGIRLHLWYWLDRAIDEGEAKAWLADYPVDLALYNPVQPHYIAKPIFEDGIADPVTVRSGLLDPDRKMAEAVAVPDRFPTSTTIHSSRNSIGVRSSTYVASREVIRDANGVVVDGREWWLYLQSLEACRRLQARGTDLATVDAKALADETWALFEDTTDLSDRRWTYAEAYEKAGYRVHDIADGWRPSSESNVPRLIPDIEPYYQLDPSPLEEAERELGSVLDSFFKALAAGKKPRLALNVTMGLGKTRQTAEHIASFFQTYRKANIELYVPRHDLGSEIAEKLRELASDKFDVVQVRGRKHHDEDGVVMCARYDSVVAQMESHGISVTPNACYRNDAEKCRYYDDCPYWDQFRPRANGVVRIMPHAYLALPRMSTLPKPDLVVVDEGPLPSLHKKHQVPLSNVASHFAKEGSISLGNIMSGALRNGQPLLQAIRDAGFDSNALDALEFDYGRGVFTPGASDGSLTTAAANLDLRYARDLKALQTVLAEELDAHKTNAEATRIRYHAGFDAAFVDLISKPSIPFGIPLLLLDGTGNPLITSRVFGCVEFKQVEAEPRAFVTQIYDRTGSNQFWSGDKHATELTIVANARAGFGHKVLVVGSKELADSLRGSNLHANVSVAHFNAVRGTNEFESCDTVIIAGRNQPPSADVDALARAVFWKDDEPLACEKAASFDAVNERLPMEARGYAVWGNQSACGVEVPAFTDPRIEAVHAQLREAETIQAIERLRLVRANRPKRVLILSNLPLPIPVHQVCRWDELMPDALDEILAETGFVTLSPTHLYALQPNRFKSLDAAKKALQRWTAHLGYQDSLYRGSLLEVTYRFLKDGKPHGRAASAFVSQRSEDGVTSSISRDTINDLLARYFAKTSLSQNGAELTDVKFFRWAENSTENNSD